MISVIHHRRSDNCDIKRGRKLLRRVRFERAGRGNLGDLTTSNYIAAVLARVAYPDEEVRHYWRCPILGWVGSDGLRCDPPPLGGYAARPGKRKHRRLPTILPA